MMMPLNTSRPNERRSTTMEPAPSWTNDLYLQSYMSGGNCFKDVVKISFKASSRTNPKELSVFTLCFDQYKSTPWFFKGDPLDAETFNRYYKSLQDLPSHSNLIKYRKIEDRKFSLRELQALLPLSDEMGKKGVCGLLGRAAYCEAAYFESPSIFCIKTEYGGPTLRNWNHWLNKTEKVRISQENVGSFGSDVPPQYIFNLRVVDGIKKGLNFLHGRGFLHNDLNPENVCFATKAYTFPVKLANFGLHSTIKHSRRSWSPYYDAPEVKVDPKKFSIQSDIFSLGLVIWDLFEEIPLGKIKDRFTALVDEGRFDVVKRDPFVYNLDLLVRNYTSKDVHLRNKSRQGHPLKLLLLQPSTTSRLPFLYGGLDNPTDEVFLGRRDEVDQAVKAILNPTCIKMLEIRGGLQAGKTSLVRNILSKLKKQELSIVILNEQDFHLDKLWHSIFRNVPGDTKADDISCILSNRQEQRWILVLDMNFSTRNSNLISKFNNLIDQFPPERNLAPFVIFTSVDQYDPVLIYSKPVELITVNDWQIDYILQEASKLGKYAKLKGSKKGMKAGAEKVKRLFKKLGIIIQVTEKKVEVLSGALTLFLLLGFSGGVLFKKMDLLDFEDAIDPVVPTLYNAFLTSKIFTKVEPKDKRGTIQSLKCPKSVARVIRKVILDPEFRKLLEKLLGYSGKVGMKRWIFDLVRGKKDNPIAKRCKMAVSERKRSRSVSNLPRMVSSRRNFRSRNLAVPVVAKEVENLMESLKNLAQETQGLGNKLGLDHPKTLEKSVDLIRACKDLMDGMCEAVHPGLLQQYGNDHSTTEFVKKLLPPLLITLDEE